MDEAEQVSQLVGEIYDAALDRSLWAGVLERTCRYVDGVSAMLGAEDSVQRSVRFFFEWGNDPHYLRLYEETYCRLNPMTVPTVLHAKVGSVLASTDLVPYDEIIASRFYRECHRRRSICGRRSRRCPISIGSRRPSCAC
jgi:hypothetical protein